MKIRHYLNFFVSSIVAFIALYASFRYFDFSKAWLAFRQSQTERLVWAFILLALAYLMRGIRWSVWSNLSAWNSVKLCLIGFMGNNLLPARMGEFLRAHLTAKQIKAGHTAALASIAVERVLDGFAISVLCLFGLAWARLNRSLYIPLLFVSALFFFLTLSLVVGVTTHQRIRNLLQAANRIFPGHITRFTNEKLNYFLDGLLPLSDPMRMIWALVGTAIVWGMELGSYYLIGTAVWGNASAGNCLIFLSAVNFVSLFPFAIGGIGTIEVVVPLYLTALGIPAHQSLAMVLVQHSFQFLLTTTAGAIFYFVDRYSSLSFSLHADKAPQHPVDESSRSPIQNHANLSSMFETLTQDPTTIQKRSKNTTLSIVIPAYNEQSRLPKTILETIQWAKIEGIDYELIIADDGSTDDTLHIARLFESTDYHVRVLVCPHMGKGAATRMGMLNARGKYVLFMDADGATPLSEIPKLMSALESGSDIAIGSRISQTPHTIHVETSFHRRIIGRTFALLVNILTVAGIGDTQCGFKMFRAEVVRNIFSRQRLNGFAFDVEILFLAQHMALSVVEIPVNWQAQPGSKVSVITDSCKMLRDIFRIRWLHLKSFA